MFDPKDPKTKVSFHQPLSMYRKIAFTFLGLTLAVILVILYFSIASATIRITPVSEDFKADFIETIQEAGPEELAFGESGAKLKGKILQATKEASKEFAASVVAEGEPTKASGKVTLINKSSRAQPLVATTRLLSSGGVLFRLVKGATVPANGEIEADVAADKPGKEGEIGPSDFTIPGLNPARQKEVFAKSTQAMTGGTKASRMVTEADLKKAEDELVNDLSTQARVEWEAQLPTDLKVLDRSILREVLSSRANAAANDKVDKFSLTVSVRLVGLAASEKELLRQALIKLKQSVPSDKELMTVDESTLNYQAEKYDEPSKALTLKVMLAAKTQVRSSSPIFDKSKLVGLSADEAVKYLKSLPGVQEVTVKLSPFWVRSVPRLKDHIRIIVEK